MATTCKKNNVTNSEAFAKAFQLVIQGLTEIQTLMQSQEQRVQEDDRRQEKMEEMLRQQEEKWKKLFVKQLENMHNLTETVKQLEHKQAMFIFHQSMLQKQEQRSQEDFKKHTEEALRKHEQITEEKLHDQETRAEQKAQKAQKTQEDKIYKTLKEAIIKHATESARQQEKKMEEALYKQEEKLQTAMRQQEESHKVNMMATDERMTGAEGVLQSLSLRLDEEMGQVEERQGALERRLKFWDKSIHGVLDSMFPRMGTFLAQEDKESGLSADNSACESRDFGSNDTSKVSAKCSPDSSERREDPGMDLLEAARDGNIRDVRKLLNSGADTDFRDDIDGWTPLHWAAFNSHPEVVALLLDWGADIHARSKTRSTALHFAWGDMSGRCVSMLLDAGATVDSRDEVGRTPLHFAAIGDNEAAVQALVEAGASKTAKSNNGQSPLDVAGVDAVRRLLRPSSDTNRIRIIP